MKTALYRTLILAGCLSAAAHAAFAAVSPIAGVFALQGKAAQTSGYLLAPSIGNDPLARRFEITFVKMGSAVPIRSYDVDMTKYLHVIIVSDDFTTFLHVHPALQSNGHFILNQRLPHPGLYHIYADAQPQGIGQQVFRFDLRAGNFRTPAMMIRDLSERNPVEHIAGYTVTLSTNTLRAGGEAMVGIRISKNGGPAKDLHPYLGALAHAVFLNARDLSYVHAHPMPAAMAMPDMDMNMGMGMDNMKPLPDNAISSPNMMLHVALSKPGTYKLWLQFRGGNQLLVAPFVITAR